MTLFRDLGSFKDPKGTVFHYNNKILRGLTKKGYEEYLSLKNIIDDAVENTFLIKTNLFDKKIIGSKEKEYVKFLEHEKIKVISYPYEWSFEQLKDAALLYLDFQIFLLNKNAILNDGNAYNVQFHNGKPIFIDALSIIKYKEFDFWHGHKEFCNYFLNPLILFAKKKISFNNWYRGNMTGINTKELNELLNLFDILNPVAFFHVRLLSYLEDNNPKKKSKKKLSGPSKKALVSIFEQLKRYIKKLKILKKKSFWDNYEYQRNYTSKNLIKKKELIENFIDKNNFKTVLDLGCNKGEFSELALKNGVEYCVGIDNDELLINDAYLRYKNIYKNFLPLINDISNPSPNIGLNLNERSNLNLRFKADCVFALAIIHHLVITKNIPLKMVLGNILKYSAIGVIEFIYKEDIMIQQMLQNREDIFDDYNFETLIDFLKNNNKEINFFQLSETRVLVFYK